MYSRARRAFRPNLMKDGALQLLLLPPSLSPSASNNGRLVGKKMRGLWTRTFWNSLTKRCEISAPWMLLVSLQ